MTNKQKQHLLAFLGLYQGSVDGIWGNKSRQAEAEFQREHPGQTLQQAVANWQEEAFWSGIANFRREEFACRCGKCGGFPAEPEEALVKLAQQVREHFGAACMVSSGVRCQAHNARVGGVSSSRHLLGKAMDFRVSGKTAAQVMDYVLTLPVRYAYAIDSHYVHMDIL